MLSYLKSNEIFKKIFRYILYISYIQKFLSHLNNYLEPKQLLHIFYYFSFCFSKNDLLFYIILNIKVGKFPKQLLKISVFF